MRQVDGNKEEPLEGTNARPATLTMPNETRTQKSTKEDASSALASSNKRGEYAIKPAWRAATDDIHWHSCNANKRQPKLDMRWKASVATIPIRRPFHPQRSSSGSRRHHDLLFKADCHATASILGSSLVTSDA
eukprot:9230611-Pyramimonas_sp.AAC.1